MNKLVLNLLIVSVLIVSCKKNDPPGPVTTVKYMSLTAGSTWNYELNNNTTATTTLFTLTSTNRDSTINSKTYHVFTNSVSANEYHNISGNDYYNFRNLPAALGSSSVENLYLKDNAAVGANWSQTYPIMIAGFAVNATVKNTITEKGITKTVKGKVYNDVIHVTTTITGTVSGIPLPAGALTTDIHTYHTSKIGMIQSVNKIILNYPGFPASTTDQLTNLVMSDIK